PIRGERQSIRRGRGGHEMGSAARLRRRLLGIPRRRGIRLRSIHLRTARKLVKRGLFLPPTSGFVCVTISCYDYIISSKGNNPHNIRRKKCSISTPPQSPAHYARPPAARFTPRDAETHCAAAAQ